MLQDEVFQGTQGFFFGIGGQAISGTTPIVATIQGPLNPNLSATLFSTGTVTGSWKFEACNDYIVAGNGFNASAGSWVDITAAFRTPNATTGTAISQPAGSATTAYVEYMGNPGAGFAGKSLRITFTPASGAGNVGGALNNNRS